MSTQPGPKNKLIEETVEMKKTTVPDTPKQTGKKKKRDWSFYAIIICVIALAIPVVVLGSTLISASLSSRKPLFGERFEGQYDNVITKEHKASIAELISADEGVATVKVELISGTLRVYVNAGESPKEAYEGIAQSAFDNIISVLPVDQFFTKDDSYHRYDLEVHVFNMTKTTEENKMDLLYFTLIKTALHETPITQFVSDPLSQEFVDHLWAIQAERDKPKEEVVEPSEEEVEDESEVSEEA